MANLRSRHFGGNKKHAPTGKGSAKPIKRLEYKGGKKLSHKAYVGRVRDMFEHMK